MEEDIPDFRHGLGVWSTPKVAIEKKMDQIFFGGDPTYVKRV